MKSTTDPRQALNVYMKDIHRPQLLTREEESALAHRWVEHRDPAAAEELIQKNLRFVVKVAMGYRKYGVPVSDLIQEGNLGLIRAVEKFDPSRGTRLISYAVWWIKAYIQSHVIQTWSLVRIGTTQAQRRLFYKLPRALAEGRLDGESQDRQVERLAEELRVRPKDVVLMMKAMRGRDLSLDAPLDDEGGGATFVDRVEDGGKGPEQALADKENAAYRKRLLDEAISKLGHREQKIVRLRHGSEKALTLRQVGEELGISRERVRQLEAQALRKLRSLVGHRIERSKVA
jgi:RNA polymerase sigma-32 factor